MRSPKEFSGGLLAPANIPWAMAAKDDGTFKPADDLKTLYEGSGVTSDKEVIAISHLGTPAVAFPTLFPLVPWR